MKRERVALEGEQRARCARYMAQAEECYYVLQDKCTAYAEIVQLRTQSDSNARCMRAESYLHESAGKVEKNAKQFAEKARSVLTAGRASTK